MDLMKEYSGQSLNERQALYLCMVGLADKRATGAVRVCNDIIELVMAWRRGNLLPRSQVPALAAVCDDFDALDRGEPMPSARKFIWKLI